MRSLSLRLSYGEEDRGREGGGGNERDIEGEMKDERERQRE